jgi:parvulin-like peptidyl-prolyl isomerase
VKRFLSAFILLALVLSACGGAGGEVDATVDETEITVGDVEDLMDPGGATVTKEQFAQFLNFEIQWQIIEDGSSTDFEISFTDDEITTEADRIYEAAKTEDETREDFLSNRGITEDFLYNIAHQGLMDIAVREELEKTLAPPSQDAIDAELALAETNLTQVCVSHILVETEEEAMDVMDRLDAGEDFSEIASEVSTDPSAAENGGVLPCGSAGGYVPEFRDATLVAPINEVYEEIVQTTFGYHVILVTARVEPTEDELPTEEQIAENLQTTALSEEHNAWFMEKVVAAEVTIDEEYGTWEATPQPQVIPPVA